MIRINLLPEKEVKRRRAVERVVPARQVSPLTILILAAMFALIGGYYYFGIQRRLSAKQKTERDLRSQVESRDSEIQKLQKGAMELQQVERITKSMLDIVYALDPEDRLLWSEKLNQLSDLVPGNVFIMHLTVSEAITKEETAGSRRQRTAWLNEQKTKAKSKKPPKAGETAPPPIYYPKIIQTLLIQSVAYSENDAERIRLINEFHDNLMNGFNGQAKIKADFMKGFTGQIEIGDVIPRVVGGRTVAEFSFTLKSKPTEARDVEKPASGPSPEKISAPESAPEAKGGGQPAGAKGGKEAIE
jgi:Tfp pilus assembly protein PilN